MIAVDSQKLEMVANVLSQVPKNVQAAVSVCIDLKPKTNGR